MTTYVDKTRTGGADNGTSWTDAYLSISSATGVAAGEEIWIDDGHTEDYGASTTLTFSNGSPANPIILLSIDSADDTLSSGAQINTENANNRDMIINGCIETDGVKFFAHDDLLIGPDGDSCQGHRNFTFQVGTGVSPSIDFGRLSFPTSMRLRNGTCILGGSGKILVHGSVMIDAKNIDFQVGSATVLFSAPDNEPLDINLESCDLTGWTNIITWGPWLGKVRVNRCSLKTGYSAGDAVTGTENNPFQQVIVERSAPGTNVNTPIDLKEISNFYGLISSVTSQYRTGGADDGQQVNAYSWKMVSNANCKAGFRGLRGPTLVKRVAGGSELTFDIFIASGRTFQDDEFAIELEGPDNTASPNETARGFSETTLIGPPTSSANITTDGSSTWNGTGVGTKQIESITYTPSEEGIVSITPVLYEPSVTVYADPKMTAA